MNRLFDCPFVLAIAALVATGACADGQVSLTAPAPPLLVSPTAPSGSLPLAAETAHFRFFHAPGDAVEIDWQEAYHAWAVQRLGLVLSRKIDYRKYTSREDMGRYTGRYNTNGYAVPELFTIHTLGARDNHETVHIYTAMIGRPSDFFNEGIAVAFQTDPIAGDYASRFNGEYVHAAAKRYRQSGALVLPLSNIVTTAGFRAIPDEVLSYREAGSFVAFLIERFGMERVLLFFRTGASNDGLAIIRASFAQVFGTSLEDAEAAWLAFVG